MGPLPLLLVFTGLASLLPDSDAIPGVFAGNVGAYHNQGTHSLWTGLLVAALLAGILWWKYRFAYLAWFFPILISYELHVIMDFFTFGRGVMLFWPFSAERFTSPVQLFVGVRWDHGIFSLDHLWTLFTESVFIAGMVLIVSLIERRKRASLFFRKADCQPGD